MKMAAVNIRSRDTPGNVGSCGLGWHGARVMDKRERDATVTDIAITDVFLFRSQFDGGDLQVMRTPVLHSTTVTLSTLNV